MLAGTADRTSALAFSRPTSRVTADYNAYFKQQTTRIKDRRPRRKDQQTSTTSAADDLVDQDYAYAADGCRFETSYQYGATNARAASAKSAATSKLEKQAPSSTGVGNTSEEDSSEDDDSRADKVAYSIRSEEDRNFGPPFLDPAQRRKLQSEIAGKTLCKSSPGSFDLSR